jgi:hypothetical protein
VTRDAAGSVSPRMNAAPDRSNTRARLFFAVGKQIPPDSRTLPPGRSMQLQGRKEYAELTPLYAIPHLPVWPADSATQTARFAFPNGFLHLQPFLSDNNAQ